ncbi:hypothetical protein [Halobacteriovorax sp.]|uniref:hypothetical protein n=1 Tax=Halobacteriovorax sp. TaxID=2020862 RepID=UPI003AF2AFC3
MKKQGRPTLKTESLINIAINLAKEGKTNRQIARTINIGVSTLDKWLAEDEKFKESLRLAKLEFDRNNVESMLLKRCLGYSIKEIKVKKNARGDILETVEIDKELPPDPSSLALYLRNRMSDVYCQKKRLEIENNVEITENRTSFSLSDIIEINRNN